MKERENIAVDLQTYRASPFANKLIRMATDEVARQWGVNYVQPEYLLSALVVEGSANDLLKKQGITTEKISEEIIAIVKPQFKATKDIESIADPWGRLTNRTRKVLFEAEKNAAREDRDISGQDILVGIEEEGDSHAHKILKSLGFHL